MSTEKEPSFQSDIKSGKVTINKNGHISNLSDYDYKHLLSRYTSRNGKCYLCGKEISYEMTRNHKTKTLHIEASSWEYSKVGVRQIFDKSPCSMSDHKKQENAFEITIPTGELFIANYFLDKDGEYAFDVPKKEKWEEKYNICNISGQNNRANYVAEKYNVGYVQINSSLQVWASKDRNKILFVLDPCWENCKKADDKKFNKKFEQEYVKLGEIDQRVWRYEFADKSIIDDYKAENNTDYEPLIINVPKGRYSIKHHYGKMYFSLNNKRYVIVTEIDMVASTREVLTEKK